MKKVRIHISKLGPILAQEIQLAQFMLFTGDSNMGKSYTNFLCYYLFNLAVSDRLNDFLLARMTGYTDTVNHFNFGFKTDDLRLWIEEDVKRFFSYLLAYPEMDCSVHFYFDEAAEDISINMTEQDTINETGIIPVLLNVNEYSVNFKINKNFKKEELVSWIKYGRLLKTFNELDVLVLIEHMKLEMKLEIR